MTPTPSVHNASPALLVCSVPRATALQLVAPTANSFPSICEVLWEGLEQSYGEGQVWLGFGHAHAVAVFVELGHTLGHGEGSSALAQLHSYLKQALEGSRANLPKAA